MSTDLNHRGSALNTRACVTDPNVILNTCSSTDRSAWAWSDIPKCLQDGCEWCARNEPNFLFQMARWRDGKGRRNLFDSLERASHSRRTEQYLQLHSTNWHCRYVTYLKRLLQTILLEWVPPFQNKQNVLKSLYTYMKRVQDVGQCSKHYPHLLELGLVYTEYVYDLNMFM